MAKAILNAQQEGNGVYMVIMLRKTHFAHREAFVYRYYYSSAIWLPMSFVTHG